MLMKITYQSLINLRLSQTNFQLAKEVARNAEKLARLKAHKYLLRTCHTNRMLPPTIFNLRLPSCFRAPTMSGNSFRIKAMVLSSMLRYVSNEIGRQLAQRRQLNNDIAAVTDPFIRQEMLKLQYNAFGYAMAEASARNNKRLQFWRTKKKYAHPGFDPGTSASVVHRPTQRATLPQGNDLNQDDTDLVDIPPHAPALTEKHNNEATNVASMVTDLTGRLDHNELDLLRKGPNFRINQSVNQTSLLQVEASLCRLSYQMKWRAVFTGSNDSQSLPNYPASQYACCPPRNALIEAKIQLASQQISTILREANVESNLTPRERDTMKGLRNKNVVCLPSDKGGEMCVIDASIYDQLCNDHLGNVDVYQRVSHIKPKTIEDKINRVWNQVCSTNEVSYRTRRSYTSTNTRIPAFYGLVKTHKQSADIKIRPIVSNQNGPTEKIAYLLTSLLTPCLRLVPAHLESSAELMHRIDRLDADYKRGLPYLCSFDVISLYTSIPPQEAVANLLFVLEHAEEFNLGLFTGEDVAQLLRAILTNTYLSYKEAPFKQISGLAMGSSVSPVLAVLYLHTIESRALSDFNRVFYARYIDDVFVMCAAEDEAKSLFDRLNAENPHIQFEMESPRQDGSISLLDFNIHNNDGEIAYSFYRKSARTPVFVNFQSALPMSQKINIIRNERARISARCSTQEARNTHIGEFESRLALNGYPAHIIRQSRCHKRPKTQNRRRRDPDSNHRPPSPEADLQTGGTSNDQQQIFYFKMPFLDDKTYQSVQKTFRRFNLPVRIATTAKSLRSALQPNSLTTQPCNIRGCRVAAANLCFRKKVVYRLCCACSEFYIGSTIRDLHTRIAEHFKCSNSAVFRHDQICGGTWEPKVLAQAFDEADLRIKEALMIKKHGPTLNRREEIVEVDGWTAGIKLEQNDNARVRIRSTASRTVGAALTAALPAVD